MWYHSNKLCRCVDQNFQYGSFWRPAWSHIYTPLPPLRQLICSWQWSSRVHRRRDWRILNLVMCWIFCGYCSILLLHGQPTLDAETKMRYQYVQSKQCNELHFLWAGVIGRKLITTHVQATGDAPWPILSLCNEMGIHATLNELGRKLFHLYDG